jgi:glycosyltransferase involved in cell wall biosynthesis
LDILRERYDVRFVLIRRADAARANPIPDAIDVPLGRAQLAWGVARGIASTIPIQFAVFRSRAAREAIARHCDGVDAVIVFGARAAVNLPDQTRRLPRLLDLPDSLVLNARAHWRAGSGILRRVYGADNMIKAPAFERRLLRGFDVVTVAGPADERWLRRSDPNVRCFVIPTAIDAPAHDPAPLPADPVGLFVGDLRFAPNIDAVHYLVSDIWPRVRARIPDAVLDVVGHAPDPPMRRYLESASCRTAFSVPSLAPYLDRTAVFVAPMRVGSGIKVKVLTAMAAGRPVVMTSGANDGIGATDERQAMIGDNPEALAAAIVRVLTDKPFAEELRERGRQLVLERFSPDAVGGRLLEAVRETLASAPAARRG